jgi:porphobilinogen synthase
MALTIESTRESTLRNMPIRLRRNRRNPAIRAMIRETELNAADLVAPFFVIEGEGKAVPIQSMPGIKRLSIDFLIHEIDRLHRKGIQSFALFPSVESEQKSDEAEEAWNPDGLMQRAIRDIKQRFPTICLIADVALDPYTIHGHDGIVNEAREIVNDPSIDCLVKMALAQAEAGVDFVAPSDMMDGRVGAIREALDLAGFDQVGILAYSAKYASSLYNPFRDALQVDLQFGDKKTYQMDPANVREALLEAELDEKEGADILMIKPALFYLDVIAKLRQKTNRPIAAYHVSGEYAMVMAADAAGYLDAKKVFFEALMSIKRAGADLIFTYAYDAVIDRL